MYERLFAHEEMRAHFNLSHHQSGGGSQAKALAGALLAYAQNIDNLPVLANAIERIAQKHTALHILPEHYRYVAAELLGAMRDVLGEAATPPVCNAWSEAYWFLADLLISREAAIYDESSSRPGGWKGWRDFAVEAVKQIQLATMLLASSLPNFPAACARVEPRSGWFRQTADVMRGTPRFSAFPSERQPRRGVHVGQSGFNDAHSEVFCFCRCGADGAFVRCGRNIGQTPTPVVTSSLYGLPKPWKPDPQTLAATPAPAPDMNSEGGACRHAHARAAAGRQGGSPEKEEARRRPEAHSGSGSPELRLAQRRQPVRRRRIVRAVLTAAAPAMIATAVKPALERAHNLTHRA